MTEQLYNVIATNIKTGEERLMAEGKTEPNAQAFVCMAVMRRGVDEEFYTVRATSAPHDGQGEQL